MSDFAINDKAIEIIDVEGEIDKKYFKFDDLNYEESEESKMMGRKYLRERKLNRTLNKKAPWWKKMLGLQVIYTVEEYFEYDSDPDEVIENKPVYMKNRDKYNESLEEA